MISDSKVIEIIGDVLNLQNGIVSINTSSENTDEWDSLEHLSILVALDQYLEGKAGELTELAGIYPDFIKYIATISRPNESANAGWHGATGRVNDLIDDYIYHNSLSPEDTIIYACGHPQMIETVKDQFIPQGFQVEQERFWKEDN